MIGALCFGNSLCEKLGSTSESENRRWMLSLLFPTDVMARLHCTLAIVFHELGHVAAGQIVGMKILSFRIGPLHAAIEEDKWKFVLPRSLKSMFAAGVSMIPQNPPSFYSRWRAVAAAAGGALANLLVGAVAVLGVLTSKGSAYEAYWGFLGMVATVSLGVFLVQSQRSYAGSGSIFGRCSNLSDSYRQRA